MEQGTNLLQTAAHEFGHSLGLSHSDQYRQTIQLYKVYIVCNYGLWSGDPVLLEMHNNFALFFLTWFAKNFWVSINGHWSVHLDAIPFVRNIKEIFAKFSNGIISKKFKCWQKKITLIFSYTEISYMGKVVCKKHERALMAPFYRGYQEKVKQDI